jgi:hypothetical protein
MDDLLDFLNDTVTVENMLSRDSYGVPLYGPPVSYACRIDGATRQSVSVNGVERTVNAVIFIPGNPTILPADRITLPATFDPVQPPILKINPYQDESGPHHVEVSI